MTDEKAERPGPNDAAQKAAERQTRARKKPEPEPPAPEDPKEAAAAAFVAALGELSNPGRGSTATIPTKSGGSFSYSYAGLDAVLDEVRPVLARHGLAISSPWGATPDGLVTVRLRVLHRRGVAIEGDPISRVVEGGPQEVGSFVTYARRYGIVALLGIHPAGEDDDAVAAQTAPPAQRRSPARTQTPPEATGPTDVNVAGVKMSQRTNEELRDLAAAPPSARIGELAKEWLALREKERPTDPGPEALPEGPKDVEPTAEGEAADPTPLPDMGSPGYP
jgi:hypothetical protein